MLTDLCLRARDRSTQITNSRVIRENPTQDLSRLSLISVIIARPSVTNRMATLMQPAIKMALRIARQSSDFLKNQFERHELLAPTGDAAAKQLASLEKSIYVNCTEQLQRAYKDHYIAPAGDADALEHLQSWHIFPLLGANNFIRGLPDFALALMQKQRNRAEHLVLINPITQEEFTASRGYGAAVNSRRMRVSAARTLEEAFCATHISSGMLKRLKDPTSWGELCVDLSQQCLTVRQSNCPSLDIARVASGQMDVLVHAGLSAFDVSVGNLLANESGALSGDFVGGPANESGHQLVIANSKLFKETSRLLHRFRGRLNPN